MEFLEKGIDYVRNKALEIKRDPKWSDVAFKDKKTFEERKTESERIMIKYPNRVPVVCERATTDAPKIDRSKYLVPVDITMGEFMFIIRKRLKLPPEESIYLFVGNDAMAPVASLISQVYEKHHDTDGFLYVKYSKESTFG